MVGEAGMLRRQTKQQWNKTVRTVVTVDFLYKIVEEFHFRSLPICLLSSSKLLMLVLEIVSS